MRFTLAAVAAFIGLVAASSNGTEVYVTDVVTAYTTYCPFATQITHGTKTYTVSEATTLTITDCPCTITKAVSTASVPAVSTPKVVPTGGSKPSGSKPSGGLKPSGTGASTPTGTLAPYKGAADKVSVGVAGVLAVAGLVAVL